MADLGQSATSDREPPSFSDCYIGHSEDDPTHMIFDARYVKRATAVSSVASDFGLDFKDAHCRVTYCRWLSLQEQWDDGGGERWLDDYGHFENGTWVHDGPDDYPPEPPEDWQPDPSWGAFEECKADAPGAVKCWKVETGL